MLVDLGMDSQVTFIRYVFYGIIISYLLLNVLKYKLVKDTVKITDNTVQDKYVLKKGKVWVIIKGVFMLFITLVFLVVIQSFDRYDGITIFTISTFYVITLIEYIYQCIGAYKGRLEISLKEGLITYTNIKGTTTISKEDILKYKVMSGSYGLYVNKNLITIERGYNELDNVLPYFLTTETEDSHKLLETKE